MSQITARFQNIYQLDRHYFEIIGCGAIGSFTAMNLARAGADKFMLWDHDTVDAVNVGVQHYSLEHVGASKVKMLRKQMHGVNPHAHILMYRKKYRQNTAVYNQRQFLPYHSWSYKRSYDFSKNVFLIIGVDSMSARKQIIESMFDGRDTRYAPLNTWIIDARMGAETFMYFNWRLYNDDEISQIMNLLVTSNPDRPHMTNDVGREIQEIYENAKTRFKAEYFETWYSDEDGNSEPCNARSTNYCASMAGAFINNAIRKICDKTSTISTNITFNFPSLMLDAKIDYSRPLRNIK